MKTLTLLLVLLLLPFKVTVGQPALFQDSVYELVLLEKTILDSLLADSGIRCQNPSTLSPHPAVDTIPPNDKPTYIITLISVTPNTINRFVKIKDSLLYPLNEDPLWAYYIYGERWIPAYDTIYWRIEYPCDSTYPGMQWRVVSVEKVEHINGPCGPVEIY